MPNVAERQRLTVLRSLDVLDVQAHPKFDTMMQVMQQWFDVPMVSITIIDESRQWRLAYHGPLDREGCLDGAICPVAMHASGAFVVTDTTRDPRFEESPYVTGDPRLRFYAGWPLHAPGGEPIGALCVMDTRPRVFDDADHDVLSALAVWVEEEIHRGARAV